MPLDPNDLEAIVTVVTARLDAMRTEIKQEVYAELEAVRQDFMQQLQILGQNDVNLYEFVGTRTDPGLLTAEVHGFWTRSILGEAERIRREIESQMDEGVREPVGPFIPFEEDEPEAAAEPEPESEPAVPSVPKQKPQRTTEG